ncbi:MAG: cytochrome c biogenesis protein CcsA, partial [Candidatus Omnitrophica bacterium]|nr:cytochrome c biogenesis protein CcsA [Candidatus Omnitrophota bacterium]
LDTAVKEFKGLSEANPAYISFLTQKTFLGSAFELEVTFNQLHPFRWASWAYFAALILFSIALFRPSVKWAGWFGRGAFLAGFLLHTYGILLRSLIAGRPPVSNMYESVIWVAWAAVMFSLILYFFYRNPVIWPATALLASLTLYLVQNIPAFLDPAITPLVPVLRSNYWLTIHVLTITLSYGAFALAMIVGHVLLFLFAFKPSDKALIESIGAWLYRLIQIGVILLASGTILGGVWAHYSWGRFWGWDPKETWALIALIGYLIILHMRLVQWIGPLGLAVGSIVAFLGVLMAWYGVNFVLAAGLHSYGFGGGGVAYVAAFIALDLAVVGALAWKIKTQKAI